MHKIGVALIYLSVAIRALVEQGTGSYFGLVAILLAIYGGLIFGEQALKRWLGVEVFRSQQRFQVAYLFIEMCLVIGLMLVPPTNDYPALLFIPLSLQAVLFYSKRSGFYWITVFTLVMGFLLTWNVESVIQGLVMSILFGGCCYLVGSYAHLIRRAESIRQDNQHTYDELQSAYRRLQGYALQRQKLAAEKERNRLARELHDSVTQTVFSMNLTTQTALYLWPNDPARVNAQFDRFLDLAGSAMHEIQALVAHLGSETVANEDLVTRVKQLISERQARDGLQVELEVRGESHLAEPVNTGLYGIVQEALTNIAKHARTQQATIRLNLAGKPSYVEIEDHGIGFDLATSNTQPDHFGLKEIAEQVSEIGWSLSIDTQPGRGTRLRVEEKTVGGQ